MIGWRVRHLAETSSTNDEALAAAATGEPEGLVIHAARQTSGRGRRGRVWHSGEGNLFCSLLLRPQTSPNTLYSFVAALTVQEAVTALLPESDVRLKWPNDVLVGGKKISGILLEAGQGDALVVGIGINVTQYPSDTPTPATSLAEEGCVTTAEDVLQKLLASFAQWDNVMRREGFAPIRTAWLARAHTGAMTVRLPEETLQGTFGGLEPDGCLRLILADGTARRIACGDVFLRV